MSGVLVRYESGFPTCLQKHYGLALLPKELGSPSKIERRGQAFYLSWVHYPGIPETGYILRNPWPGDTRRIMALELQGGAQ